MSEIDDLVERLSDKQMDATWQTIRENLAEIPVDTLVDGLNQTTRGIHGVTAGDFSRVADKDWREAVLRLRAGRRWLPAIEREMDLGKLKAYFQILLDSDEPLAERVAAMAYALPMAPREGARDLSVEFVHFRFPRHVPLMSQWVYSWKTGTGALPYLMEFTNTPGLDGRDRFCAFGSNYDELAIRLKALHGILKNCGLNQWGAYSLDVVLAYLYSDYLYKMYFTTSKSVFSTIPTVLGVMAHLLGLSIPREAVPTGVAVENPGSGWMD